MHVHMPLRADLHAFELVDLVVVVLLLGRGDGRGGSDLGATSLDLMEHGPNRERLVLGARQRRGRLPEHTLRLRVQHVIHLLRVHHADLHFLGLALLPMLKCFRTVGFAAVLAAFIGRLIFVVVDEVVAAPPELLALARRLALLLVLPEERRLLIVLAAAHAPPPAATLAVVVVVAQRLHARGPARRRLGEIPYRTFLVGALDDVAARESLGLGCCLGRPLLLFRLLGFLLRLALGGEGLCLLLSSRRLRVEHIPAVDLVP